MAAKARTLVLVPLCTAMLSIGCESTSVPASVEGTVTYHDAPVTCGTITFHPLGTEVSGNYTCRISDTGTYKCSELPAGEMAVTVETESVNPSPNSVEAEKLQILTDKQRPRMGSGPVPKDTKNEGRTGRASRATYIEIPTRYTEVKRTPLKTKLTKGKNTYNAVLED